MVLTLLLSSAVLTLAGCLDAQTAANLVEGAVSNPSAPSVPASPSGTITIRGTGGTESVQVELTGDATFAVAAGQFVVPLDASFQRMMMWETVDLSAPGTYTIAATCMQRGNETPDTSTLFDATLRTASTNVERCQTGCGGDQECVWRCQ